MPGNPFRVGVCYSRKVVRACAIALFFAAQVSVAVLLAAQELPPLNYVIGSQDVLAVTSQEDPALTGHYTVQADGTFSFPYIGEIKAAGLSVSELEQALKQRLKDSKFFVNPQLLVTVEQYRSQSVVVMGEVRTPGARTLTGSISLLEVIAQAGSLTPTASGVVIIVRPPRPVVSEYERGARGLIARNGTQGPIDGLAEVIKAFGPIAAGAKIIRADLSDLQIGLGASQNGSPDRNIPLEDGDTVIVLAAEKAFVSGEVKLPGAYPVLKDTTVLQILALAGGMTPDAAQGRVQILRPENGKQVEIKNVKMTDVVQPGDTIIVPTRYF